MAALGKLNIDFVRGDDYSHVLAFQTVDCDPLDISGRTYAAQVRKHSSQTVPDATFICVVTSDVDGIVTITLTAVATAALSPGEYMWDLEERIASTTTTLLGGKVVVLSDVTR